MFQNASSVLNYTFQDGNVGIGTTSPDFKLDVEGSVNNADIGIRINNTFDDDLATSNPNAALFLGAASNNGYLRVHGAPANTAAKHQIDLGSTAGDSFLTFSPNGGEKMRITSGGDVGIGTTSPGYPLDIVGFANSSSGFRVTDGTIDNRMSWSSGNIGFFGTISNHPIAFNTNSIERMRITSAGDVLVGKTGTSVGTDGVELRANGLLSASRTGTSSNNVAYFNRNPDGGGNYGDGSVIQLRKNNVVVGVLGTEEWGIGTDNPAQALHVVGNAKVTGAYYDSNNSPGTAGQVLSSTVTGTDWVAAGGGGTSYWTATGNDIYNNNSANVGIGISQAAAAKLEVTGTGTTTFPIVRLTNASSDLFNHTLEVLAPNLAVDETNALIIGQRVTAKNAGYLGYLFSSAASNDNVLTFGHIGATNLMALTGDGKLGIGNVGPSQALHVTGNARVTGAFYDSNNSAGSSGQVLSSTATGTDWVAAGSTVYTPDVFEITTNQSITSQGTLLSMSGTQIIDGSTGATIPSGGGNTITATQNGVYEISYTMYLETTHNARQIIGAYIEKTPSGSQPSQLAGSFSSVYMRVGGSNQGFAGTITNTFYAVLAANDAIKIRMGRTDSNVSPTGISIQVPDYPTSGVKHVISLRKINAAS
jgi:hypothetical protein